jgi:hypothetical protein
MRQVIILLTSLTLAACGQDSREQMVRGLKSCKVDSMCIASYYFGEQRDKLVTRELLTGIEDVRISHDIRHKGMSVYYCKMGALRKISGLDIKVGQTDKPDSIKIRQFIKWAADNQLIGDKEKIDTRICTY